MRIIDVSTLKFPNTFTMVDDEDFDWLNQWKWYVIQPGYTAYVVRNRSPKGSGMVWMHREILQTPPDMVTDHLDHNGINNQKSNLRVCTKSQNACNMKKHKTSLTSIYKGVCLDRAKGKLMAQISINGKKTFLGYFSSEMEAVSVYNKHAKILHGEFANPNKVV